MALSPTTTTTLTTYHAEAHGRAIPPWGWGIILLAALTTLAVFYILERRRKSRPQYVRDDSRIS